MFYVQMPVKFLEIMISVIPALVPITIGILICCDWSWESNCQIARLIFYINISHLIPTNYCTHKSVWFYRGFTKVAPFSKHRQANQLQYQAQKVWHYFWLFYLLKQQSNKY